MNDEAGPYAGMPVEEARAAILRDLEDEGFLDHIEDYTHSVGRLQPLQDGAPAAAERAVVAGREQGVRARPLARRRRHPRP